MDISRLIIHPIGLKNYACDPSDGHSSVCYYTCCSRNGSISNCTTRRGTSLGEEIAGGITYDILEGCSGGDDEQNGDNADSDRRSRLNERRNRESEPRRSDRNSRRHYHIRR